VNQSHLFQENLSHKNSLRELKELNELNEEKISGLPEVFNGERRREERIPVNDIPVEITGTDRAGQHFNEQALVKDVNDLGCRFDTRAQLRCGDIVAVKPLEPNEKVLKDVQSQLFEVMWAANHGTKCTVGTRRLQGEKLANAKFLPPNDSSRVPTK